MVKEKDDQIIGEMQQQNNRMKYEQGMKYKWKIGATRNERQQDGRDYSTKDEE